MKRYFLTLLLVVFCNFVYSQNGKAILILKDSTQINGIGEVSGFSSIVTVKYSNDTLKYKTYRSKEIIGIDILENDYKRKFRYKYVDGNKFPEIVEVLSNDNLSLYLRLYDEGSIAKAIFNGAVNPRANFTVLFPRASYYVGTNNNEKIKSLYTCGLPFAKSFKNSMKDFFKDCPELLEKVENKEFTNDNLLEVLNFYNTECLKKEQN